MWSRPGGRHYVALPARHRGATQREAHSFPLSLVLRCGVRGGVSPGASPTSAGTPSLPKRHPRVAGPRRNAGSAETESPPAAAHAQRRARRGAPRPDPKTRTTSGRSVPLRPEPQRGEEALNPSRLPPEEAGESGTRRRTADGQGGAAAPHWSQCSEFFEPGPGETRDGAPGGNLRQTPPRGSLVPWKRRRGGCFSSAGGPPGRTSRSGAGAQSQWQWVPARPAFLQQEHELASGRERREKRRLPKQPEPSPRTHPSAWSSLIVFSALRQDRDRSRRGRSEDLTKPSNRVARVQPRTSKGITDLLLLNLVWLNATCPSKKLDADRTGPRN
ncbi:hypothetical protein NQZ68_040700 [Dissostichus eleginoides]|nr:hypothetical protein NQZ68_040700 [Dissostichus eleginoides]